MTNKAISVYAEAMKRNQEEEEGRTSRKATPKITRKAAGTRKPSRDPVRDKARGKPQGKSRDVPSRDEIQEFSFRLRDELKVKVQAEVPHKWQRELAEIARELDVKRLELYRFILGEFLGKVRRKRAS